MAKEINPGVKCRIIGSARGPEGSSIGRVCRAVSLHPIPHVVWGDMWDCEPLDGKPFEVKITSPDGLSSSVRLAEYATLAADWLEPLEDDELPPAVKETEKELTE